MKPVIFYVGLFFHYVLVSTFICRTPSVSIQTCNPYSSMLDPDNFLCPFAEHPSSQTSRVVHSTELGVQQGILDSV